MKTTSAFMAVCTALLMFSCSGDDENSQSTPLQLKTYIVFTTDYYSIFYR